jgi:hypothetical protein
MKNYKEELRDQLFDYLSKHPEDSTYFLDVVSSALKNYEKAVNEKRDIRTSNAIQKISYIIDSKTFKGLSKHDQFLILIDTLFIMFPLAKITGHSQSEINLYNYFVSLVKEVKIDYDWFLTAKGQEVVQWMKELIWVNQLKDK